MPSSVTSLLWIAACAAIAPLVSGLVPRRLVPEVVLLLALGVVIGPNVLDLAVTGDAIGLLRELGLAMLFLLAGYEIDPLELTGRAGRFALGTWLVCLAVAVALVAALAASGVIKREMALAIALTSTALGTLLPIFKDADLMTTPVGRTVLRHGAYGELGPVVAIAVLLGSRAPAVSVAVLVAFVLLCLLLTVPPRRLQTETSRVLQLIREGAETTGQTPVRLTMLLLVALTAIAEAFKLDVVLAAFAAGFILRQALPDGDDVLESKIEGLAFGLLIPIFFVTSGMAIDPDAIAGRPAAFVVILVLILVARGIPVYFATRLAARSGDDVVLDRRQSLSAALFSATGLPIIVAVTSVAVADGQMTMDGASLLVAAGAATVLLFPMLATLTMRGEQTAAPDDSPLATPD
jgi:Kef-type K+ transport system membrane component KefB